MPALVGLWVGVGVVSGLQQFVLARRDGAALTLGSALGHQVLSALPWIVLTLAIVTLVRRVPLRGPRWPRTLAFHGAAALATALMANLAIVALHRAVGSPFTSPAPYLTEVWDGTLRWVHVVVVVYGVIAAVTQVTLERARRSRDDGARTEATPLTLQEGSTTLRLDPREIDWLEADGDYVRVHREGRHHLVNHRLAELAERLVDAGFVRVHRSAVVHPSRVRAMRPLGRGDQELTLTDGARVRVSRRRAGAVKRALNGL
ncbi:MAG: LytTR family DNA-binding domain-containing protein [Longimicrobiales bacterium]